MVGVAFGEKSEVVLVALSLFLGFFSFLFPPLLDARRSVAALSGCGDRARGDRQLGSDNQTEQPEGRERSYP